MSTSTRKSLLREFAEGGFFSDSWIHVVKLRNTSLSVKVRDDYGRTVLHDACWTVNPNEELVEYLISKCPDLLFFNDKRGSAPLEYVRKEHWDTWLRFLSKRRDILPRAVEEKANSAATIPS